MKQWSSYLNKIIIMCALLAGIFFYSSCKDDDIYITEEPEWLGASIYDYLEEKGGFDYYLRLIDDVGYTDVMKRTGSKTVFAASDEAFARFFNDNPWKVGSYEELSKAQKNILLNFSSIDNAYLIETLANYFGNQQLNRGTAIRRASSISVLDTIGFEQGNMLPAGKYWDPHRDHGLYLVKDDSSWPLVHFLEIPLKRLGISDSDFELIAGVSRQGDDAFIFNSKIIERDITCKNGYVHILEEVLIPRTNMAQHLNENKNTTIFSELLERFSAPYIASDLTENYRLINPGFNDTIYSKEYFSESSTGGRTSYPDNTSISADLLLPFNPGYNSYVNPASSGLQSDMAAMLVPTDEAMNEYFNNGAGVILKERFGTWQDIPNDIIVLFLNRHMRTSFINTVPSRFDRLRDAENSPVGVSPSHIVGSYVGLNGVIYHTNNVYPPDDYISVYAPVAFSDRTKVMNWAIKHPDIDFRLYLNSLVTDYSFFVPTDDFFENYLDCFSFGMDESAALKFWFNTETNVVNATVYSYDAFNDVLGDSVGVISNNNFIRSRLQDLLDSHIVIGDVEEKSGYYLTKGNNPIFVQGKGLELKVKGGGDIEKDMVVNVQEVYDQVNGRTYFIDKPIQNPLQSVFKVLSETPEFSEFYQLIAELETPSDIFVSQSNNYGIDLNVRFFNTFHYTVYVPTNEAINKAIDEGLIRPLYSRDGIVGIKDMDAGSERAAAMEELSRFVRYHFQDNALFLNGQTVDELFQTSTIKLDDEPTLFGTYRDKYYRLRIKSDGNEMTLTTEIEDNDDVVSASVVKDNGLYNILTRDYVFSLNPSSYAGPGTSAYASSVMETSSTAIIHQIDNVLYYKNHD